MSRLSEFPALSQIKPQVRLTEMSLFTLSSSIRSETDFISKTVFKNPHIEESKSIVAMNAWLPQA